MDELRSVGFGYHSPFATRNSLRLFKALLHDWIKSGVEQALYKRVGRVIGARHLALAARELGEAKASTIGADLGTQGKQAFIDAAQFLSTQVLVVHRAQHLALAGEGEAAQGLKEIVVS